ncbi:hypothetical protein [Hymenobacter sp.]|uniref:hypothetical protein n=1 Tax=Hymenobacter sp. TaxID=1898978 RepID=UPI00286A3785|nr:hypothetical protein [Hymenobacter sp.]
MALALIPAAALIGAAPGWNGLERLLANSGFVVVAGLVIFGVKQAFLHRRKPLV